MAENKVAAEEIQRSLENICELAKFVQRRRGNVIKCEGNCYNGDPYFSDACIATTSFWSGHASVDATYDTSKMHKCPYRTSKE